MGKLYPKYLKANGVLEIFLDNKLVLPKDLQDFKKVLWCHFCQLLTNDMTIRLPGKLSSFLLNEIC